MVQQLFYPSNLLSDWHREILIQGKLCFGYVSASVVLREGIMHKMKNKISNNSGDYKDSQIVYKDKLFELNPSFSS